MNDFWTILTSNAAQWAARCHRKQPLEVSLSSGSVHHKRRQWDDTRLHVENIA